MNPYTKRIISCLDKAAQGTYTQSQIFDDWLDIVKASLEALPNHLKNANAGQPFADTDTDVVKSQWERLRDKYEKSYYWNAFTSAFAELVNATDTGLLQGEYEDVLGEVYMEWGTPNRYTGQFFTPWHIAKLMAEVTFGDISQEIQKRIIQAAAKDVYSQAVILGGLLCRTPSETADYFYKCLLPAIAPHFDTFTVHDPACGSGVMLLASASKSPRWAVDYGLIQFSGMDIDMTCVRMAQINCMLYGLNGYSLKCALACTPEEINSAPANIANAYKEAQEADRAGDQERVSQIADDLRAGEWRQSNLFEVMNANHKENAL